MAATLALLFAIALIMACLLGIVVRVIADGMTELQADERACANLSFAADDIAAIAKAGVESARRPVVPFCQVIRPHPETRH